MRKGDIIEGTIEELRFPNKGVWHIEDGDGGMREVIVSNVLPGQRVSARIVRRRSGRIEAKLLEVLESAPYEIPAECPKFGVCGGCQYLNITRRRELQIKESQVRRLLTLSDEEDLSWYEGICESPVTEGYRNKMELTFGDAVKDGPLTLGMHRRGSFYDVIDADACRIVDGDYRKIIRTVRDYWADAGVPYYRRMLHEGYLRHLIIRKGRKTGEILVDLVTTTQISCLTRDNPAERGTVLPGRQEAGAQAGLTGMQGTGNGLPGTKGPENRLGERQEPETLLLAAQASEEQAGRQSEAGAMECYLLEGFTQALLALSLDGVICGILHTRNDSTADIVEDQGTEILYGKASFEEVLLGLHFTVTPFSFFQTNSAGAELLYETARNYIARTGMGVGSAERPVVFDLYCGTGTISLLMSPAASRVIGVDIVEEAIEAARENAVRNGVGNCEFICGDVLKVINEIEEEPDLIILDPPRDGVHPKALPKILKYGVPYILYISCKPTSLARDLAVMRQWGYEPVRGVTLNQFPKTANCETVCLLSNLRKKPDACIDLTLDMKDFHRIADAGDEQEAW